MADPAQDALERARTLIGTPFRPQGRDPKCGLDCVGFILSSYGLDAATNPQTYRLRGPDVSTARTWFPSVFRRVCRTERRPGDVLLVKVATEQIHLIMLSAHGFVHADLRLGLVVEVPGAPPWPIVAVYRCRSRNLFKGQ